MYGIRHGVSFRDGGIVGLGAFVAAHSGAIEYDLLTKTGHELKDVGASLSWQALASFVLYVDENSALHREMDPERAVWAQTVKTNGLLADIYDLLAQINANLIAVGSHKKAKHTKPYPRPGMEEKRDDVKHFGKNALPPDELRAWFARKREEHGRKHD